MLRRWSTCLYTLHLQATNLKQAGRQLLQQLQADLEENVWRELMSDRVQTSLIIHSILFLHDSTLCHSNFQCENVDIKHFVWFITRSSNRSKPNNRSFVRQWDTSWVEHLDYCNKSMLIGHSHDWRDYTRWDSAVSTCRYRPFSWDAPKSRSVDGMFSTYCQTACCTAAWRSFWLIDWFINYIDNRLGLLIFVRPRSDNISAFPAVIVRSTFVLLEEAVQGDHPLYCAQTFRWILQ